MSEITPYKHIDYFDNQDLTHILLLIELGYIQLLGASLSFYGNNQKESSFSEFCIDINFTDKKIESNDFFRFKGSDSEVRNEALSCLFDLIETVVKH